MYTLNIGKDAPEDSPVCSRLQEVTFNSIRKVLPDKAIEQACTAVGYSFRNRILTPIVTILHMILAAIWPEESFQASWQMIWDNMVAAFPSLKGKEPSSGSLAKARLRLPLALWERVWDYLVDEVQTLSEPFARWHTHRVVLVDGTCLSMPDTPSLHEHCGTSRGRGDKHPYPLARIVTVALANTFSVLGFAVDRYNVGEIHLLRRLFHKLQPNDLLVGDRHYAGANLYAEYLAAGLQFLTRAHHKLNISRLRRVVRYGPNDFLADLPINPLYRRKNPALPATVRVRLIKAVMRIRGHRQVVWFATSLLDSKEYPAKEIVALYARRWRIETLLFQLKVGLSADVLRSKTPDGVLKEIAARMAALNVVRAIMLEAATTYGQDPTTLSFVHSLRAILAFAPHLATAAVWKLPMIYQAMLHQIAIGCIRQRPGRLEPRMVRRENKH
ncbi:MAG: IS4 family transposase, partial [Anaerolineales bacterium]|nr:IS4 family transposase [Anaerolineales bacterium]